MSLQYLLRRALTLPPHMVAAKAARRARASLSSRLQRRAAARAPTYAPERSAWDDGPLLARIAPRLDVLALQPWADALAGASRNYLDHRFDLLGSGWVRVHHGMVCRGLGGHRYASAPTVDPDGAGRWLDDRIDPPNLPTARRLWSLVDEGYVPIDWQLDFKSGFRWSERDWHADVSFGTHPGVDVKVPWELARGQHLVQLAVAHALAATGDARFSAPHVYTSELRNQILDFMATNPPARGVNWRCTMDVGIRVASWVLAHDLFLAHGANFDAAFERELAVGVVEHGRFIRANLEWSPELRSNHYLANLAGLLFAAAYLPPGAEADEWLRFSTAELISEVELQFHDDGSNFEASTAYHRLSAEMVLYATSLACAADPSRLPGSDAPGSCPFPAWYATRLRGMAGFTQAVTKPSGRVVQVGDNDSGRFVRLLPPGAAMPVSTARRRYRHLVAYDELPDDATYWLEDHLDHRHLVAAVAGLVDQAHVAGGPWRAEARLVAALASVRPLPAVDPPPLTRKCSDPAAAGLETLLYDGTRLVVHWRISVGGKPLTDGLETLAFPGFGIYVLRSARLFLSVRCGSVGQGGNGGHAHNDQLAVELSIDGEDWAADPGTYLYTPLPAERNRYRSVSAHFAPRCGDREPAALSVGLFQLPDSARARCLAFGPDGFLGVHLGYGEPAVRRVSVRADSVDVFDALPPAAGPPGSVVHDLRSPGDLAAVLGAVPLFSPGYGELLDTATD